MPTQQTSSVLTWTSNTDQAAVMIAHSVIERMSAEAMRGFGLTRRRGTEMGGILLGSIPAGRRLQVLIEDFEVVPCEYSQGPSYILSDVDRARFREAMSNPGSGLRPVGFFRSHTREGLSLATPDLDLYSEFFGAPMIGMVLKPYATRTPEAGIFLPRTGSTLADQPSSPVFRFIKAASAEPVDGSAPVRPPMPAVAETMPDPVADDNERAERIAPPPVREPLREPVRDSFREPVRDSFREPVLEPEPDPEPPVLPERPERVGAGFPDRSVDRVVEPPRFDRPLTAPTFLAPVEPSGVRIRSVLAWVAFTLATIGFGAAIGYQYGTGVFGPVPKENRPTAAARPASTAFDVALTATAQKNGVLVSWNLDSAMVKGATRGVLTVSESGGSKQVDLSEAEIKNGNVIYHNLTGDVTFTLELWFGGRQRYTESVKLGG